MRRGSKLSAYKEPQSKVCPTEKLPENKSAHSSIDSGWQLNYADLSHVLFNNIIFGIDLFKITLLQYLVRQREWKLIKR